MVESAGTTPSETGSNGKGGTTDFAGQLDAATLAAVSGTTTEQGGIESLAPGSTSDTTPAFQPGVTTPANGVAYVMQFDGCFGSAPNGVLDPAELMNALFDLPSLTTVGAENQMATTTRLLSYYGEKVTKLGVGSWMEMSRKGAEAMFADRSVYLPTNYSSGQDLGINFNATSIERVIRGASYGDPESTNDGLISGRELVTLFATLGLNVSAEQAHFLLHVYGDGNAMSQDGTKRMRDDGFLNTGATLGDGATLNWDNIDGGLIADALCGELGLAVGTGLEAAEFDFATDKLFNNTAGVNSEQAAFLTRLFGTGGKLNREQIAGLFENNNISMNGVAGEGIVRITVNTTAENMSFADSTMAANYIMLYDTNNDGLLYTDELRAAITSRIAAGQVATDTDIQAYMNCYGGRSNDGNMFINRDGVLAMLNDSSLSMSKSSAEWARSFDIVPDAIPIARVIMGASYGDLESGNDGLVSNAELVALFSTLGLTLTSDQAVFLIKVYGDGAFNGSFLTQANVQKMRDDGFLTTGAIRGETCSLNWNNIDGGLLAREIFRNCGLDPNVENVSMNGDLFSAGFKTLYGDSKTLKDPAGLTNYFGLNDKLTVAQMGSALNAVNTVISYPTDGEGRRLTSLWDSALGLVEGAADDVVSTISTISGVAENVVAQLFNGTTELAAMMVNDGNKIIPAIVNAIKQGDETAKKLIGKLGLALTKIPGLADKEKKYVADLITAAQTGLQDTIVASLCTLVGLPAAAAAKAIKAINLKLDLQSLATTMTVDKMTAFIPDYASKLQDMVNMMDAAIAALPNDAVSLQKLAEKGYTLDSNNNLVKGGITLSADESKDVFAKFFRLDLGVEFNFGAAIGGYVDGGLVSTFLAYKGTINGEKQFELRFRVIDEAGVGRQTVYGGTDAGLINVHDMVIPWSVAKDGSSTTMKDVLWNSSIAGVAESQVNLKAPELNVFQDIWGVERTTDGTPLPPTTWLNSGSFELGGGWGLTVSYNLSKMGGDAGKAFVAEIMGASAGTAIGTIGLLGVNVVTEGETLALTVMFGVTVLNATAILGSFAADAAVAYERREKGDTSMNHGFFVFGAVRENIAQVDIHGISFGARARLQISYSNDPWGIM
jgi:hypothetical protein